jgi:transcriptional regulator with XRE-family HTH domain
MAISIGEKIKRLRKDMHLTQTDLAGSEISKSMLSQIENNTAMPSMKSLQYIADRLNKPVSYFLDDGTNKNEESHLPMNDINALIRDIDNLVNGDLEDIDKAKGLLEEMHKKYDFDTKGKIYAYILCNLGYCLIRQNSFDAGETKLKEAVNIYTDNHMYLEASKASLKLMDIYWDKYDYEGSLNIIEESEKIYNKSVIKDVFWEIEILYNKASVNFAIGNIDETFYYIDKSIYLSKISNLHYNSDEIYRMKANLCLVLERYDDYNVNIKKAQQFAEFTENKKNLLLILLTKIIYENRVFHPEKALELLETFKAQAFFEIKFYYYTEKAKALYSLGDYTKALENMRQVNFLENEPNLRHKYDYLNLWEYKVYEGLILCKLGNYNDAVKAIMQTIKKIEVFSSSKTLVFAYKSLSEVYSESKDYENAYIYLKKSVDTQNYLKEHEKILY